MSVMGWESRLRGSPELFPFSLDLATERVELVALQPVDYEKASFLDARLAAPPAARPAYAEIARVMAGAPEACDYIFHIGHVGSTLLSRLLGTHPAVFSLREPEVLRTLAQAELAGPWGEAELQARLGSFTALFSRTWAPGQRTLVKATSLVGELASRLLTRGAEAQAILMTVAPESYLATILGGPNSRLELRAAAPARLARLQRRIGEPPARLEDLSEGEAAAMSWACEMTALLEAGQAHPQRTSWIDFDRFLDDPRRGLAAALGRLHGRAEPEQVERIAGSAYFERYSKAPEYGYGPDLRRQVLDAARHDHAEEIRRGLAWLEAAGRHAPVGRALDETRGARHDA